MPREAPAAVRLCAVPGCTRRRLSTDLCRLHYDRQRKGTPLSAPRDPRQERKEALHGGRSHREALRELAVRLADLHVVEDEQQAEQLVALLVVHWPFDSAGDSSLFGVSMFGQ